MAGKGENNMKYDLPDGLYFIPVAIKDGRQSILSGPVSLKNFIEDAQNGFYDTIEFYFNPKGQVEKNEIKDEYGIREALG